VTLIWDSSGINSNTKSNSSCLGGVRTFILHTNKITLALQGYYFIVYCSTIGHFIVGEISVLGHLNQMASRRVLRVLILNNAVLFCTLIFNLVNLQYETSIIKIVF